MEISLLKALLSNISLYFHLSSSDSINLEPAQKYYKKAEEILKLVKPILDVIVGSEVASNESLNKAFGEIHQSVEELRELFESWQPLLSKIDFIVRVEVLISKIRSAGLDTFQLLKSADCNLPDELSSVSLEKIKHIEYDHACSVIREAIKDQAEGGGPSSSDLVKIAESFSLKSNQEILIEAVALEKLKENAEQSENTDEVDYFDQLTTIVTRMHDRLVLIKQSEISSPVRIPADFCCPLSLELMTDPVIAASGQTYERAFIRKWLDLGLTVCPKTRQTLIHTYVIPNYTLKALIANWCESKIVKLPDPMKSVSSNQPLPLLSHAESGTIREPHIRGNPTMSPESVRHMGSPVKNFVASSGVPQDANSPSHPRSRSDALLSTVAGDGRGLDIGRISLGASEETSVNFAGVVDSSLQASTSPNRSEFSNGIGADERTLNHKRTVSASSAHSGASRPLGSSGDANGSTNTTGYSSDASGEVKPELQSATNMAATQREPEFPPRMVETRSRSQTIWRRQPDRFGPRIISSPAVEARADLSGIETEVRKLVDALKSDSAESQKEATAELRLLAKHNMDNRIVIANCGAINLLVNLLRSPDNTESVGREELAAVTETNMEVTSLRNSASSSAVNNGSVEVTAAGVSNSAQFPDSMMPKQEELYQQDGLPSSTSMSSGYDYDVFLSFRGPDTRLGITNFLYTRLLGARIHTFKDDEELRVGEEFGPELLKAISQSKVAIPIFSKGYASSKWCLNELVQMVEFSKTRRQKIMPIFYDVSPAEVRHQIGSYKEAFLSHEEKFGANVSKWKAALKYVADLNGWDNSKKNRGEGELVDKIVQKVINELKMAYLLVTDCLVGVENHVKEIDTWMCGDSEDVRILGIHGMGGVGKTTLAKIIYNRLAHHFEACCFLSNIRETSELKGIECLQTQLISDILKKGWSNISNAEEGIKIIKERLCDKKVLVLLDDVDQMTHWDALIGKPAWFGLGSRIIITSRNRDIVDVPEVSYSHELMSMNFNQSLQLFCEHAFGRDCPPDGYVAFSTEIVKSTGGLPLALEAIGKLLPRRSKDVWDVILKKLKQVPLNEVKRKLKISYDALDDWQKDIFLDIACLFAGSDQRVVLHSWKDSNLFPEEGLEVLQKMSLIKISEDNKLWMHDQLRGLGRDIVSQEYDKVREKQTRLWNHEEGLDVVMETEGIKKVEALCRKFDPQLLYYFANEEVASLSNPTYPKVRDFQKNWPSNDFPANLQNSTLMLSKLRWLSWHHFPLEIKITNFIVMNIVILHLEHCLNLIDLQSIEGLASLKILKLIEIPLLERLPNVANLKKLNELHLGHCHNLTDVQSIEGLKNVRTLKLIGIPLLERLPDLSNLKKLAELHLRYCHGLIEIKSFEGLENLMMLKLGELPLLERLPNLSNLKKLTRLDLRRCHNLLKIQGRLESLEDLCIQGCRSLDEVLDPASSFKKLKSLRIHDCEKLRLDKIWVSKFEITDRVDRNSTCLIRSKIGICVCQLGRRFFLPSLS